MLDLFVTGVEYNKDKICVSAGLLAVMQSLGYSSGIYKPVDIGAVENYGFIQSEDLSFVKFIDPYIKTYFSYLFKAKTTPLLAAAAEKSVIERNIILKDFQTIQDKTEVMIVEGISGLATPLNKNFLEEDIIKMFDLPVLFTMCAKTNSINNFLLSVNRAKEAGLKVRGAVINNFSSDNNDTKLLPRLIEEYSDIKTLGILPVIEKNINPEELINLVLNNIDIEAVFNVPIAKLRLLNE